MSDVKSKSKTSSSSSSASSTSDFSSWLEEIYNLPSIDELKSYYETFKYDGFNRDEVLNALKVAFPDKKLVYEIVVVCALRGPRRASETKLSNGKTLLQLGVPSSGLKGKKGLSCSRITSATADLAAAIFKSVDVPKRIKCDCPGWLQFPAAGSIIMNDTLRASHIDFSKKFSERIGGKFNEDIYDQMVNNAYLNPKLNLFN